MDINEEFLAEVKRLGAAAYSPRQTAFALGCKPAEFMQLMQDENHVVTIAYFQGFYGSELAVRESALMLARNGSSPAQTLAVKLFEETRKTIRKDEFTEEEI